MSFINLAIVVVLSVAILSCRSTETQTTESRPTLQSDGSPDLIANSFAYPIGNKETATQKRDRDEWFNALDFGEDDHLGEDWNKNTGGNSDCGEPVFAAGNGKITFAADAGPGWGNVLIVTHKLRDGSLVQTLYGHLQDIVRSEGEVKKRELIGKVGNANGRYLCHLHFELRESLSPMWNKAGGGYATDRTGWLDPSDFIDSRR